MKKKKVVFAVTALCVAVVCGGCSARQGKADEEYDALNAMLEMNYSQIALTVTNDFGEGAVLASEYTMKFTESGMTVNYSVERFSELSLDTVAPEKTTLTGEATVAGGEVTYVEGDEVNLDAVTAGTGLSFKREYFENSDLTGVYLKADVANPSAFMGTAVVCSDMKVFATFFDCFREIKITYKSPDGSIAEYNYAFKK